MPLVRRHLCLANDIKIINENAQAAVRVCGQEGSWFATSRGTRQGDPISPTVFIADLERAMDRVKMAKKEYQYTE